MSFVEDLGGRLEKKGLSTNSVNLYMRNLSKINGGVFKNLNFLKNVEDVNKKLEEFKPNTRKSYLTCLVSVLGVFPENKGLTKLKNKYYELMTGEVKKIKETPSDALSKTQAENWIDWDDVKKLFEEKHAEVMGFWENKSITDAQYTKLLNLMVMALYVLVPPRRNQDYMLMNIKQKVNENDDKKSNYLDLTSKEFIFNVFKTAKHFKDNKESIPEDLFHIIQMYMRHHPLLVKGKLATSKKEADTATPAFLVFRDGSRLDKVNTITRILNKIFGKNIGVSMLRHSYLTGKYGKETKEREADAEAMGHSLGTQSAYIKDVE